MKKNLIKNQNLRNVKKGVAIAALSSLLLINHINSKLNNDKEIQIYSKNAVENEELNYKVKRTDSNKTYKKEDLLLMVENLGENPEYYFVDGTNRDIDLPYIKLQQPNGIEIDSQKTTYTAITDPEHEIIFRSNIYHDAKETENPILGRDGTIYLNQSGNIPMATINEIGIMTNFLLPEKYQDKIELSRQDLENIQKIYNENYAWIYLANNDCYNINDLFLVEYNNQYHIFNKQEKTYLQLNLYTNDYAHVYTSITDLDLGLKIENGNNRLTSSIKELDYELTASAENINFCNLTDYLTESQIERGFINREEAARIEIELSNKNNKNRLRKLNNN